MTLANGYVMKSTFIEDFRIAEAFGAKAIKDTFKRAFNEWKDNIEYVTELAIATNLLCWDHFKKGREDISQLYTDMYYQVDDYVSTSDSFTEEDRSHYYTITD